VITLKSNDPKFEAFLEKQFGELKREIDAYLARNTKPKEGKVVAFKRKSPWVYSIAAIALVAVATPMVMQLNQQKLEQKQEIVTPTASAKREESPSKNQPEKPMVGKLSTRIKTARISRSDDDSFSDSKSRAPIADQLSAADRDKDSELKKEAAKPTLRASAPMQESPAEAQSESAGSAAPAAPAVAPAPAPERASASRAMAMEKDDSPKIDEKAEMESLWKEFEKNPEGFGRDKKRSARLKTLLARHETKSKSRARRVQAAESKATY